MPELQRLAMDILSLVGGACSCERSWSAFDFIHSKKRNRLSPEKCEELVYVFSNLRLLRKANSADAKELFYACAWVKEDSKSDQALQISASVVRQGGKHYSESHSDTCSDTDEESCGPSDSESDGN